MRRQRLSVNQLSQLSPRRKHHVIDLGKVVVLTRDPEDGRMRPPAAVAWRARARRRRLERREKRPANSPPAARYHRARALPQRLQGPRTRRALRPGILLRQQFHQLGQCAGTRSCLPARSGGSDA